MHHPFCYCVVHYARVMTVCHICFEIKNKSMGPTHTTLKNRPKNQDQNISRKNPSAETIP